MDRTRGVEKKQAATTQEVVLTPEAEGKQAAVGTQVVEETPGAAGTLGVA